MSAFFRGLRKNSLENFSVLSFNDIGHDVLKGLMQHAASLRTLSLLSLHQAYVPFLRLLSKCQCLESLEIEGDVIRPSMLAADYQVPFPELGVWLKENKHLKTLRIGKVGGVGKLLADVLKSPELRLRELEVFLLDDDEGFYTALGSQTSLESLQIQSFNTDGTDANNFRHDNFVASVCACPALVDLNIMRSGIELTLGDLVQLQRALPNLASLSFDGDWLEDEVLVPLAQMPSLTTININGISVFTYQGVKSFLETVKAAKVAATTSGEGGGRGGGEGGGRGGQGIPGTPGHSRHRQQQGFRLYVMAAGAFSDMITREQAHELMSLASQIPGGAFEFDYWRDPDEELSTEPPSD